ncbi:MAG: hypothetical protein JWM28_809 [Chitinophagaceae bacterium]|nr:hypothetical protein [Chitinophagaceae bacterium]
MKNLLNAAVCSIEKCFTVRPLLYGVARSATLFFCSMIWVGFLLTGCSKDIKAPANNAQRMSDGDALVSNNLLNTEEQFSTNYEGLDGLTGQTLWELQQARAATARYRQLKNAIADGYADISVVVPNMGYHYMQSLIVDATFDARKPEILVYNRHDDGSFELVAVEYAVPIDLTPNVAPEGFTGSGDVWDRNTGFGLWLLHAWVWHNNPDGVFNPTNPEVHVH